MSQEDEIERRFQEDLRKAIELSLETENERLKNEQRRKSFSQYDHSANRSTTITLAPRPRPGTNASNLPPIYSQVSKLSSNLPPPPTSSRKQSTNSTPDADLISFNSPTKPDSATVLEELNILSIPSKQLYPDLSLFPLNNNAHRSASISNPNSSSGFPNNALKIDCPKTEVFLPHGNNVNAYPRTPSVFPVDIGFKRDVLPRNAPFAMFPSVTNTATDSSGLDVLKVVGKQNNNNLIDLAPKLTPLDSHSVLEAFDPLAPEKLKVEELRTTEVDGFEVVLRGKDDEGSIYDTYDPFDYMYSPTSVESSQGEPLYSAVEEKLSPQIRLPEVNDRPSTYGFVLPAAGKDGRTAEWLRSSLLFDPKRVVSSFPEKTDYKNRAPRVEKLETRCGNAELGAFCQMVTELRSQFPSTDICTNPGLVHAATVDCSYPPGTTVKLIVTSQVSTQPITFTPNLSSSVDHVISHVLITLESKLPSITASDYVLKIDGISEYLVSDTLLGEYEYLHQCIKLDEDVLLNLVPISDLKRPLARTLQDDRKDVPVLVEHLLPTEPAHTIKYEEMVILLDILEKEINRILEAARDFTNNDNDRMPQLQPKQVSQAVKALCSKLGEIETVDISDSIIKLKKTGEKFLSRRELSIGEERGIYSSVSVISPFEDEIRKCCENIWSAVYGLIESYCRAFTVDFRLAPVISPSPEESRTILDFSDPVLIQICEVHRLNPEWNTKFQSFMIEVQMYHGTRPVRPPHRTIQCSVEKATYERLAFSYWMSLDDIVVNSIPREARLVFVLIGLTPLPADDDTSKTTPPSTNFARTELGWAAIHCFDHEGSLMQGSFLLSIWPILADKRMGPAPEPSSHPSKKHPVLRIFLPHYALNVVFPPLPDVSRTRILQDLSSLDLQSQELLKTVSKQDMFSRIEVADREIFWEKRYYLHNIPEALPKILLEASSWAYAELSDLHTLLHSWAPMDPFASLQLLLPCFPDSVVRSFAVKWIRGLSNDELSDYLPQLVQALKNETYENNCLAHFLLERSLISPRVAHHLFWLLVQNLPGDAPQNSTESVSSEEVDIICYRHHRRLRILLRALLMISGESIRQRLCFQQVLVKDLFDIASLLKVQKDKLKVLQDDLTILDSNLREGKSGLPLSASITVAGIDVPKCGFFQSKTLPLKLHFFSEEGKSFAAIFKVGDPLQQDMLTLQMIRIMDKMWLKEGIDLKIVTFGCVPTGHERGMIELVKDAETLKNIQIQNGLTGCFKDRPIAEWLQKHNSDQLEYEKAVQNFTASCAGYTVATYVLGICDRHNDNIMLKKSGHLFHIDFGKFLGDAQMFLNFKRDRSPFVLTSDMAYVINGGDRPNQRFQHFVDLCCNAFAVIRKNSGIILNLMGFMVNSGIPGVTKDSLRYVQEALLPGKSKPEASAIFAKLIDSSLKTWFTSLNFFLHSMAQARTNKGERDSGNVFSFVAKRYTMEDDGRITGVAVLKAQKRYSTEKFYVYVIRVERLNQPHFHIFRTYAQICELHQKLCILFPLANLHSLPDGIQLGRSNIKMVAERRIQDIREFFASLFSMADEIAHSYVVYTFFHPILMDQEEADIGADKLKEGRNQNVIRNVLSGQIKLGLHYQEDKFTVMVHHGRDFSTNSHGQQPSTYVKTYLLPDPHKTTKRKTRVVKRNCDPSFMEGLEYRMKIEYVRQRTLEVSVWNYDSIQENEFLGSIYYDLRNFSPNQNILEWFVLGNKRYETR